MPTVLERLTADPDFAALLAEYDAADAARAQLEAASAWASPAWHKAVELASRQYRALLRRCDQLDPVAAAGLGLLLDLR